jgi:replicative DNA helicase
MPAAPQSIESERALLAHFLLYPLEYWEASGAVGAEDFALPAHREIFAAIENVARRQSPIDVFTVADELKAMGTLERVGGEVELTAIAADIGGASESLAGIVREKAKLRRLIALAGEITAGIQQGKTSDEIAAAITEQLVRTETRSGLVKIGDLVDAVYAEFEKRATPEYSETIQGVRFGLTKLDWLLGGLREEEHCVIGADVGGGKTALGLQAALNVTLRDGGSAIVFSLEMSAAQICERAFAHLARVNSRLLRSGRIPAAAGRAEERLGKQHFADLLDAARKLKPLGLYVETKSLTMRQIHAKARAWRAREAERIEKAHGLVVVDFLQLVRSESRAQSRAVAVGEIAYSCKELAKTLGVPLISLSQFKRKGDDIEAPNKHDLKESGDIEASADQIVLLHNKRRNDEGEVELVSDGPTQIIVDKNRSGECRAVQAYWSAKHFAFCDLVDDRA